MRTLTLAERSQCKAINRTGEFFTQLSSQALRDFESLEFTCEYASGTVLFMERQIPNRILVVLEGQVKLSMNSSEGKRLIVRVAKPCDILGLSDVLTGNAYDVTAETIHACKIASVRKQDFLAFLARHPEAYCAVTRELSLQCGLTREQLRNVGLTPTVPKRLARLLLDWCSGGQQTESGTRMNISLTHEEIGECIGASRESVTRTLSEFRQQRLVAQHGATMMIPNRHALEAYARA